MFTGFRLLVACGALATVALVAGPGDRVSAAGESSCAVFPADNPWNTDISAYPVHARSDAFVNSVGRTERLHPDFGTVWNGGADRDSVCHRAGLPAEGAGVVRLCGRERSGAVPGAAGCANRGRFEQRRRPARAGDRQ